MNLIALRASDQCQLNNRNFKGRQGSASGRTLLMSPAMVAAAIETVSPACAAYPRLRRTSLLLLSLFLFTTVPLQP